MKIKKINTIKNLGVFKDFSWDSNINDFEKDNLIYGWNYSGKTTLSRLFRILEKKKNYTDMISLEFELELENGSKITKQDIESHNLDVRVFNKEYVEEVFGKFEGVRIGPIYIALGKDKKIKKNLDKKMKELSDEKGKLTQTKQNLEEKEKALQEEKNALEKYKSDQARNVRRSLELPQSEFQRQHFEEKLKEKTSLIDNEESLQEKLTEYRQKAQDKIFFNKGDVDVPENAVQDIKSFLMQKVSLAKITQKLESDPQKREWVQKGVDLHRDIDVCSFCDNKIPSERIDKLESFFSSEYKEAQKKAVEYEEYLDSVMQKVINIKFPVKNDFIESKRKDFGKLTLEQLKKNHLQEIQKIVDLVKQKKEDVTKKVPTDAFANIYIFDLNELERLVQENNTAIDKLDTKKEEVKEILISHFTEEKRKKVEQKESALKKAEEDLKNLQIMKNKGEKGVNSIESKIKKLEASTSSVDAGLEQVNSIIQEFLGHNELVLEKADTNDTVDIGSKFLFSLKRGGRSAKDLSEGEKTVISFAYFFVKLNSVPGEEQNDAEDGCMLQNTIIFIDDPISSFDDQHLSYMASFISNDLHKKCKQLFISTHNFTFFDFLRKSKWNQGSDRIDRKFFIEARKESIDSDERIANLKDLPKLIDKHKSEYNYMFQIIYNFSKKQNPNDYLMFPSVPNAFRNFLETYRNIQYPGETRRKQLERFIRDDAKNVDNVLIRQIVSEAHKGSHSSGADSTRPQLGNPIVWQEMVKKVLKCIKINTKDHFECLEKGTSEPRRIKK